MSKAELKSKLHQFIDELNDDKILEAVYEALNSEKEVIAYLQEILC